MARVGTFVLHVDGADSDARNCDLTAIPADRFIFSRDDAGRIQIELPSAGGGRPYVDGERVSPSRGAEWLRGVAAVLESVDPQHPEIAELRAKAGRLAAAER